MKIKIFIAILFLVFFAICIVKSQKKSQNFDDYFLRKTLRMDFHQAGDAHKSAFYLHKLKEIPHWSGSLIHTIDTMRYGDYMIEVFDTLTSKRIYSRGFSSLFYEWQDTPEAQTLNKSFETTLLIPFPKKTIRVEIKKRTRSNLWNTEFKGIIDVSKAQIIKEQAYNFDTKLIHGNGQYEKCLDIAIIAEGYSAQQIDKFHQDAKKYANILLKTEPFDKFKTQINIWSIDAISDSTGTDFPSRGIWKTTILDSNFDTFGSARYLTSQAIFKLNDIGALVPYDQLYILVNTSEYGGGGIYNFYNLTSADHELSTKVFTHEFGHGFGALADEYETDGVLDSLKYDFSVEIAAPNLTTLVEFEKKWKNLIDTQTPIPTPPLDIFADKVGAFEGGGYVSKKIYRPMLDCKMRSNNKDEFCPVCQRALEQMLIMYIE